MKGALFVAGTGSDVGKSVVVAGLCRWLARQGIKVAPFKAQNMSLNSAVTPDGGEIGRAQAAQAAAAMIAPEPAMNPILLKPVDDRRAQVIVMGRAACETDARAYDEMKPQLLDTVLNAFDRLRSRFDVIVCEGAGSPAEINLRDSDLVNMGLAGRLGLPVVLVGDIDKGGVFASLYGSVVLLDQADQRLISGFIINKFRGDYSILEPGLAMIEQLTGRPVFGVLPWIREVWSDAEDAVPLFSMMDAMTPPLGRDTLDIAVVALGRMSNFTDFDPLVLEPGVTVRFTTGGADLLRADLVVIPGSKATVDDLASLRARGLDSILVERARNGGPILGICGGYQMLGRSIVDQIESRTGRVAGLGLLPVETVFESEKVLATPSGRAPSFDDAPVGGYEIHQGRVRSMGGEPLFRTAGGGEGCRTASVIGTSWHGIFEADQFRASFLQWVADQRGLEWLPGNGSYAAFRESRIDRLADAIEQYLDLDGLTRLIECGPPPDPTLLSPGAPRSRIRA
jgi:adenosylcobyric acid synthase